MNNNKNASSTPLTKPEQLRSLAGDLTEVHGLLDLLCAELGGGGIVPASDLEPVIAEAVPKLRNAVNSMQALATDSENGSADQSAGKRNPLLM